MTAQDFLDRLDGVKPRGVNQWVAKCPAHDDRSPSLRISEGGRGILLKCFAGCSLQEITDKLRLAVRDLFFDSLTVDPAQRRHARQQRQQERIARQAALAAEGWRLNTLREADYLIRSAQGISIDDWSDTQLDTALDRLGDAYHLLATED